MVRALCFLAQPRRSSISMDYILGIVIRLGWNAYRHYGGSRVVPVVFFVPRLFAPSEKSWLLNDMISTFTLRPDCFMLNVLVCTYLDMNGVELILHTILIHFTHL